MAPEKPKSDEPAPLQDSIHLRNPRRSPTTRRYLIFVLTGNPGLIEYYRPFMMHLFASLSAAAQSDDSVEFQVCGYSMQGFEIASAPTYLRGRWLRPFGLQEQVRFVEARLCDSVAKMQQSEAAGEQDKEAIDSLE